MLLRELFEAQARKVVAVMPGGFHPFHPGHKSLYDWAVKTFGQSNVYVAATNDTAARPFPFDVKKKLAGMAGVPESNFIQVKSPFNAMSYQDIVDDNTALVFVRSQKDKTEQPLPDQTKKNGEPGYLRTYTGKDLNTSDEMGYMAYGPTINFDFSGMQIKSASELRATWPEMSDEDKLKAAKLMYGNGAPVAVKLLNQALGDTEAPVGEAMPYTGKSPQYKGVRIPTDDTVDAKDITKKSKQVDMPNDTIDDFDFSGVDGAKLKKTVARLVSELPGSPKNIKVLQARFGLAPFQKAYTLQQVADAMGVTPEVARQREAKAIRMLKHPSRSRELRAFMDDAPPGREKQVKALKKKFDDPGAPYAIAWAQHNKRGKPKKEQLDIDAMLDEILGFATKRPKTNTVKRRPPEPEQDSVQDKIKQRRALASKVGTDKAFRHDSLKGK